MTKKERTAPLPSKPTADHPEKPGKQRALAILHQLLAKSPGAKLASGDKSPYAENIFRNVNPSVARDTAPEEITEDDKKKGNLKGEFQSTKQASTAADAPYGYKADGTPRKIAPPRRAEDLAYPELPPSHSKNQLSEVWNSRIDAEAKAAALDWLSRHPEISKKELTSLAILHFLKKNQ